MCKNLGDRKLNDPDICDNPPFWSKQACPSWAYPCKGRNNGQCGTLDHTMSTCDDKSDQVFSIGQPCNMSTRGEDVLNCGGSCTGAGCPDGACSNPDYPRCAKDNTCYEPSLRCDMHPTCSDAEDEKNCLEMYKKRSFIPPEASFPCKSLDYPDMVEILAVRCNSVKECFEGLDEEDCKQALIPIRLIGGKHTILSKLKNILNLFFQF